MRVILFTTTAAILALSAGAGFSDTRDFDITGFARVEVAAGLDVSIVEGEGFEVTAEGSRRALKRLQISRSGDTLELSQKPRGLERFSPLLWMSRDSAEVRVTLPSLEAVTATSGSDVVVQGAHAEDVSAEATSGAELEMQGVEAARVRLSVSSGAELSAAGRCGALVAEASSGAQLEARELTCDTAEVAASSGAELELFAETVRAEASSGAEVEVWGAETLDADTSSGGDVDRHD